MLTVINDWSVFLDKHKESIPDFRQLFINSKAIIARSLQETKQKLLILAKSNVVDAGANAFVVFIEGIIEFIHSESIRNLLSSKPVSLVVPDNIEHVPQEVNFRYCTEGILKNITTDNKTLATILKQDAAQ
jgi:dihydroxyacetone kinase-like predicted kinase